jgi:hypothetical protein
VPGFTRGSSRRPRHRLGPPCGMLLSAPHTGGGSMDGADVAPPGPQTAQARTLFWPLLSVELGGKARDVEAPMRWGRSGPTHGYMRVATVRRLSTTAIRAGSARGHLDRPDPLVQRDALVRTQSVTVLGRER